MLILLIIVHIVVCIFLTCVVLVQQSKSSDVAAAFGGQGSQTAFGPRGAATMLTKVTAWSAVVFMLTSIALTVVLSRTAASSHSVLSGITQSVPAKK